MNERSGLTARELAMRVRLLVAAGDLFQHEGYHAVTVDAIALAAGVAKTTFYRAFESKDTIIAAFLTSWSQDFWDRWDETEMAHPEDPRGALEAHLRRIERTAAKERGCPFQKASAEFIGERHSALAIATAHKTRLESRLQGIAIAAGMADPGLTARQLYLLIEGFYAAAALGRRLAPPALALAGVATLR